MVSWLAPIAVIFAAPFLIVLIIDVVRDDHDALRKRTGICLISLILLHQLYYTFVGETGGGTTSDTAGPMHTLGDGVQKVIDDVSGLVVLGIDLGTTSSWLVLYYVIT